VSAVNPWRELEKELNPRQREAVFTADPHCLVLAGPGTGKTRTLVNRVVYLVSAVGAPPESILTLTFTRKAARVMVERLARYLGEQAGALRTGTFHHFCLELLRDQAGRGDIPRDFGVADEPRQIRTLERAWNRLGFSARPAEDRELRMLLGRFGAWRVERDPALLSGLQEELFAEYQRLLREERAIDFDDILHLTRDLLREDAALLAETRRRWPHVLVDEFQDTDSLQYELLRLLAPVEAEAGCGSFLVADDQQSIYAWRGADRRNVENYRRDYSPRVICLEENYRNREAILAGARAVLAGGSVAAAERPIVSRADGAGSLRVETFPAEQEEAAFLAADIRSARARQRGLRWGQIAILYPKHSIGEFLETRLMGERVPVELVSGRALLEQPRIRRVTAALRILRNGNDDEALGTLLAARLDEGSYALLRRVARGRGDSLRAALDLLLRAADRLRDLRKSWERFREAHEDLTDEAWLAAFTERFPDGIGLAEFLSDPDADDDNTEPSAADRRRRAQRAGDTLSHLARLPWVLGGVVARLGNLRTGQSGRGLGQLVREILMEFEDVEESAQVLPGDPADHEGLAEILTALGVALRKGRRVKLSRPDAPETVELLAALLREGREPWHAQCIVAGDTAAAIDSALELRVEKSRLLLRDGRAGEIVADGAPGALLVFRLAQLWRAADHRPLLDYVLFDFETTGADPARCELVEIAAIRFEGGREVGRFESLVRPSGPIPPGATQVHGITDAMVADAPLPAPALQEFLTFLGDRDLVAHNGAGFDFPILRRLARAHGLPRPANALFDTLALARRLFPGERASLAALIDRFGIKAEARHRALDDCRCLAEAFDNMQELHLTAMRRRGGRESLAPAALALHLDGGAAGLEARSPEAFSLFREGVRRLLASGNDWLDRHLEGREEPGADRRELEAELLAAAGLSLEAPDLFTGLRSEEERFLSLVPRFDELYLGDSLAAFLDFLALYQASDFAAGADAVQMMTIHAAKGLEFEQVYIAGLEENVLPGYYALRSGDPEELDEERRLLYVGMTRAAAALTLTRVESRGGFQQEPSRFLSALTAGEAGS
jgi:DNA helicase II / ATP-dependent DNA helicase PcrA